jgi:predicted LPLAT superfamily acyltransferase
MRSWSGRSVGSALGFRIFIYLIRNFGLSTSYFVLYFVSGFYYLTKKDVRRVLAQFYQEHLEMSPKKTNPTIRKNMYLLGKSLVDRTAYMANKAHQIGYTTVGESHFLNLVNSKRGAFLLSAHLGNWEIAGGILSEYRPEISVVMYQNEKESIQRLYESAGLKPKFEIIHITDDLDHVFKIYSALKKGHLVCMHGDRYLNRNKTFQLDFLNGMARFPRGPFELCEKFDVPYSIVFATKSGKFDYHLSATKPKKAQGTSLDIATEFVTLLEQKVRAYPEQWFNYFPFHDDQISQS